MADDNSLMAQLLARMGGGMGQIGSPVPMAPASNPMAPPSVDANGSIMSSGSVGGGQLMTNAPPSPVDKQPYPMPSPQVPGSAGGLASGGGSPPTTDPSLKSNVKGPGATSASPTSQPFSASTSQPGQGQNPTQPVTVMLRNGSKIIVQPEYLPLYTAMGGVVVQS